MPRNDLALAVAPDGPPIAPPAPEFLNIPLDGHEPVVGIGDTVGRGRPLAEGWYRLHAPLPGTVADLDAENIRLNVSAEAEPDGKAPIKGLYGDELSRTLAELGAPVAGLGKVDTLVVNGLEPEPGVTAHAAIMAAHRAELKAGLAVAAEIMQPAEVILVKAEGSRAELLGNRFALAPPRHPFGLDPLAVKAATGKENPSHTACLSVRLLFALGQVAEEGRPLSKAMVSVAGKDFLAPLGTPVGHLLKQASVEAEPGDKIVVGGPMRGRAAFSTDQGIGPLDYAVTRIPAGSHAPQSGMYCPGCGDCVAVCPARIRPDLISRASEFGLYERARQWNVHACMECGLCSYVCTGSRPVLQYIVLAKKALAELDRAEAAGG